MVHEAINDKTSVHDGWRARQVASGRDADGSTTENERPLTEKEKERKEEERALDDALDDSFPASDPPSQTAPQGDDD